MMLDHDHDDEFCPTCWRWDPLARLRKDGDPALDVLTSGTVFFDLIFTGLQRLPQPGEELWSTGMGSCPGGIANLATASARLGMRTGLVTGFGDDTYGEWMRTTLEQQEHIDLSASKVFDNFHSSLTVSLAMDDDRGMVTHGHGLPEELVPDPAVLPQTKAAVVDLTGDRSWVPEMHRRGALVFADVGFDATGAWDPHVLAPLEQCAAFSPNAIEAMAYTRTSTPKEALYRLADLVPLAIVTDGSKGAWAIDQETREAVFAPSLEVEAIDATGAGDVFAAAMILGTLAEWPLEHRLRFAALSSSLAVLEFGGSLAAPGWGDLSDWWRDVRVRQDSKGRALRETYGFMDDLIPRHRVQGVRRAQGTFAMSSDA